MSKMYFNGLLIITAFLACVENAALADINEALIQAAGNNDLNKITEILQSGNPELKLWYKNYADVSAIMIAGKNGHAEAVSLLIKAGAPVNSMNGSETVLMKAAENGHAKVVSLLIEAKADLNHADDSYGHTALILSADHGHTDVVIQLIKAGANLDKTTNGDYTALIKAASNGHVKIVHQLIAAGADLNKKSHDGRNALRLAQDRSQCFPSWNRDKYSQIIFALQNPGKVKVRLEARRAAQKVNAQKDKHEKDMEALYEITEMFGEIGIKAAFTVKNREMNWDGRLAQQFVKFCDLVYQGKIDLTEEELYSTLSEETSTGAS